MRILFWLSFILLSAVLNSCSIPTRADNSQPKDAQLSAQVLQIIRQNPDVVLESVSAYQQKKQDQQQRKQVAFLQKMKANPKFMIGDSPTIGAREQKIVLIEFSDFECIFCGKVHQILKQFIARNPDQVTLVHKHLPLTSIHSQALSAAKASWAAGQQGKFWEFHDMLFTNQDKLNESTYVEIAKSLNLDIKLFNQARNSSAASAAIEKDIKLAEEIGIDSTPMLAMNGEPIDANTQLADLEALLHKISKQ
ncbi:DSBA oxidoreductase [Calothrix sp. NIES-4071]|nr:DSBA oxidoreductase [Calothrix sp. NIES-4071]BAZ55036.1 DSBA oxidoreductase [Calothrix sp. NIES-4105]